jgi:hypothetical protein
MPNILETFDLINSFRILPKGWNFGEGVPASANSLRLSQKILRFAFDLGLAEAEAFPGINGEIQVGFYDENYALEITAEINGTLTVAFEKEDETVFFKEGLSLNDAIKILKDFTYNKCHSYVSSISNSTTIGKRSVYQVWHLDPRQETMEFPLSVKSVSRRRKKVCADISQSTILSDLQELLSFSGKYRMSESHPHVGTVKA